MSFEDVICIYDKFNSGNREAFFEAEKMKSQVILHSNNIWLLIQNINNQEIEPQLQLFIINLINELLKHNYNSLPIYEIHGLLGHILSENILNQSDINENVVNSIYDLIGLFKFVIYIMDNRFCFDFDVSNYGQVQHFELFSFLKCFNSPPQFIIEKFKEKQSVISFINNQMKPLLLFLNHQIKNKINESIINVTLCSSILFNQAKKGIKFNSDIIGTFLMIFQNNNFNEILMNFEKFTSSSIIEFLSNILNYLHLNEEENNDQIFENIFNLLVLIISNSNNFFIDDAITNSFCIFMSSIPVDKRILSRCENFSSIYINFIHQILHENYYLAIQFLSSSTIFLYNIYEFIPSKSPIQSSYISLFESFIRATNESIEKDPILLFNSLFNGSDEIKATKKIVISLLQASENIIERNVNLLLEYFNSIIQNESQFTLLFDVKKSFVIYVSSLIIKYDFNEDVKRADLNLISAMFNEFVESQKSIENYKSNDNLSELYASEKMIVNFLEMVVKKYVYNSNAQKLCPIVPIPPFNGFKSITVFIFTRLWSDIIYEMHLKQAEKVMSLLSKSNRVIEILTATGHFQIFLDNYLSYPKKSIVYKTIAKISFANNSYIPFIQKVYNDLFQKFDVESVKILFKSLSAFFQNAPTNQIWEEIFHSYQIYFWPESDEVSKSGNISFHKVLLKFLLVFINSAPKDVFKSAEPYSYYLFFSIIQIILNLLNKIIENLANDTNQMLEFEDDQWNIIELILQTFDLALRSNFVNYGVMKLYDDQRVFEIFSQFIFIFSKTSHLNLLARPQLNFNLSNVLNSFACYFKDELKEIDQFWNFFIFASKVILMSDFSDSINSICQALTSLLSESSILLRRYFVLALDALEKKDDLFFAVDFLIQFYKIDEKFVFDVGQLVENFLDDNNVRTNFSNEYYQIWSYVDKNENNINYNDFIQKIKRIKWHNLPGLERCFSL